MSAEVRFAMRCETCGAVTPRASDALLLAHAKEQHPDIRTVEFTTVREQQVCMPLCVVVSGGGVAVTSQAMLGTLDMFPVRR